MDTKENRNINLDLIRVIFMIFVIAGHAEPKPLSYNALATQTIWAILTSANCCFYMLSGELNLKNKNGYRTYYLKRMISVLFPYVLVTCILSLWEMINNQYTITLPFFIKHTYSSFMTANANIHLWFMYPLMGMLLSAPFLAKMLNHMEDREIKLLFAIGIIWGVVSIYLTWDIGFGFSYSGWILSGWMTHFFAGYFCERIINEKNKKILYIVGAVGFVITVLGTWLIPERFNHPYDTSPAYLVYSMAIYTFLKMQINIRWNWLKKIISFLANHSFVVYMLHWYVLPMVAERVTPIAPRIMILYFGIVLGTLLISLVSAVLLNTCVIHPIQKFMKKKLLS